jgi:hypothetical protein
MKRAMLAIAALGLSWHAAAFEVKGYTPGMEIDKVDLAGCEPVQNADSGVPGYMCNTTLGGNAAELRIAVFERKVIALVFLVPNARMKPTLDALSEKYGTPNRINRYSEDYYWHRGDLAMSIQQERVRAGEGSKGQEILGKHTAPYLLAPRLDLRGEFPDLARDLRGILAALQFNRDVVLTTELEPNLIRV